MDNNFDIIKDQLLPIDEINKNILSRYNMKDAKITSVKFKDTDKQRAVYRIDFNNASYCLKKVYYDEENLLFVYSAMEWCFRNGIDVPRLIPSNDGNRFLNYKDMLFILTPWLDGIKCDFDNMNHVLISAKTLGRLHKTSKNFYPIEGSFYREGYESYYESISKHFNQILSSANKANLHDDRFSNLFLNSLDYNLELAKISLEISSSINEKNLTRSLCHGDFVNKNILINPNNTISIIDFDKCQEDFSARDISYFLRRLLKREGTNWQTNLTMNIIDNYTSENELTRDDFKYILCYLCFPQKYWKLSRDYYRNIKRCNKASFSNLLDRNLNKSSNQLEFTYSLIKSFNRHYDARI